MAHLRCITSDNGLGIDGLKTKVQCRTPLFGWNLMDMLNVPLPRRLGLLVAVPAVVVLLVVLVLGSAPAGAKSTHKLGVREISASKLAFSKKRLKAKHGRVTITLHNNGRFPHAIAIAGKKSSRIAGAGKTVRLTLRLKKG